MAAESQRPLVVIAGPTASGKTALAIKLALKFDGEIICADSRTVYKGMDVGTAKPTIADRALVPHWGIDLVKPGDKFTVADFKAYCLEKIADIRSRGKVPFLVGGTGLYLDAVIFDFTFGAPNDAAVRRRLENMTLTELQEYCNKHNINPPLNQLNHRHLIRAIERNGSDGQRNHHPLDNSIVVAIATTRNDLRTRIHLRAEQFLYNNVVKEATELSELYGWDNEAMTGNVYPLVRKFIQGEMSEEQLYREIASSDWRLAKRQLTWLRRNEYICWSDLSSAEHYIAQAIAARLSL